MISPRARLGHRGIRRARLDEGPRSCGERRLCGALKAGDGAVRGSRPHGRSNPRSRPSSQIAVRVVRIVQAVTVPRRSGCWSASETSIAGDEGYKAFGRARNQVRSVVRSDVLALFRSVGVVISGSVARANGSAIHRFTADRNRRTREVARRAIACGVAIVSDVGETDSWAACPVRRRPCGGRWRSGASRERLTGESRICPFAVGEEGLALNRWAKAQRPRWPSVNADDDPRLQRR